MTDLAAEAQGPEQGKAALRQGWYDFALASHTLRAPARNSTQTRYHPTSLAFILFFSRRATWISTDLPFPLTHNAPCAIENPGAQVSRPARPDSCRQNKAYYSSSGCHDEAIESETSNEGPRRSCCCDSECAAADNALYATQLSFSIRSRARG